VITGMSRIGKVVLFAGVIMSVAVGGGQPFRKAPRPRARDGHDVTAAEGDPDAPILRDAVAEVHGPIVGGRLRRWPPG
jgi:hypothetical protein